jgi:hypothetical protein
MKITVESTDKIVDLVQDGVAIACRVWEGETASGVNGARRLRFALSRFG